METLITTLTAETQNLKAEYMAQTKVWAEGQLQRNIERRNRYTTSKMKDFNSKDEYYKEEKWFHTAASWNFTEAFITKAIQAAEAHYADSIVKLADRIVKKGLNLNSLNLVTTSIDQNINTVITDGSKTVKASTVLAYGPIQRPHYRYIIK